MDRGAWQVTVHGVARVGHDLASIPPYSMGIKIIKKLAEFSQIFHLPPKGSVDILTG